MRGILLRILSIFTILILLNPSLLLAATERRIALVIGNSAYSSAPLKNPVNDASDMAAMLKKLGFSVTLKTNAGLQEMEEAIDEFGNRLKKGGVGLFYYAGHGVQVNGTNYLLPVRAKIDKESDVKYQAVDAGKILDEMATANNGLNIIMLDACRDNPFARSFRSATRGLAIVSSAPSGIFISYSTSPGNVARDGEGRNSPYTAALLKHIQTPGLTIGDVFINVRKELRKETGQVPWELSSLEGQFYFVSDSTKKIAKIDDAKQIEIETPDKERKNIEKKESRQRLETRKKELSMVTRPSLPSVREIKRDGHFIAYNDGTVLDTRTNLMWAAKDNGTNVNWANAKNFCENYRVGGYSDWRMPAPNELAELYDGSKQGSAGPRLTYLIQIATMDGWVWTSEAEGSFASAFKFSEGRIGEGIPQSYSQYRALPVRSIK